MKFLSKLTEKHLFWGLLLLNLLLVWSVRFYVTVDGAAHLYNSNLLNHLLTNNNDIISQCFTLNKLPLPNWLSHIILGSLLYIFPAWIAEKLLITFYLVGMALSFRLLIKTLCYENRMLSILIFPFSFSFLFQMGFYNFSMSFMFYFFTLYYWVKTKDVESIKKYIVLAGLLLLTYLCNALTYGFLGLTLGLLVIVNEYLKQNTISFALIKAIVPKMIFLSGAAFISMLFLGIFMLKVKLPSSSDSLMIRELIAWLGNGRELIFYGDELHFTQQISHILIAILSVAIFIRFSKSSSSRVFRLHDALWLVTLVALVLFFCIPTGSSAGMMSDRYCILFFMLFIVCVLTLQPLPKRSIIIFSVLIIVFHLAIRLKQYQTIREYSSLASRIEATVHNIPANSLVYPINMSDCWLDGHLSNYLGVDKPMVILENYEATRGWFPLNWNKPFWESEFKRSIDFADEQWFCKVADYNTVNIDYIFCYGNMIHLKDEKWESLTKSLSETYQLVYQDGDFIRLYKRIK